MGVQRSLRVVVADDERDAVLMLVTLLEHEGHRAKAVYTGRNVLPAIEEIGADAALIDINLPGATGYEVAREIRRRYGAAAPLLIAVTAWNKSSDKALARLAGFDYHIGKPYEPNELMALLYEAAHGRRRVARMASVPEVIPIAPQSDTLHSRLLRRLVDLLGGTEELRRELMVPSANLRRWTAGVEQMPTAVFLRATDALARASRAAGHGDVAPHRASELPPGLRIPGED